MRDLISDVKNYCSSAVLFCLFSVVWLHSIFVSVELQAYLYPTESKGVINDDINEYEWMLFRWTWWLVPMPFSAMILIYDETRKYLMRHRPGGWLEHETYY